LCRLTVRPGERASVHAALFDGDDEQLPAADGADAPGHADDGVVAVAAVGGEHQVAQRRRSVAHYLTLIEADPSVVASETAYREAIWKSTGARGPDHAVVAGQWAALVSKDVWQEALCSVWSSFCRAGLAAARDRGRGLTWEETKAAAAGLVAGPPSLAPDLPTAELAASVASGKFRIARDDDAVDPADASLEQLRALTDGLDTATSGLVVLLELSRRAAGSRGRGWDQAASAASAWQPSLAQVLDALRTHLATEPTAADTLWWLVTRFVLPVHERIAYSKLPEFTFRFRWEDGLLRFYDQGTGRFPLAAIRNGPLALMTRDLGLWAAGSDGKAAVTAAGSAFVAEAFG